MTKSLLISVIFIFNVSFLVAQDSSNPLHSSVTYLNFLDDSLKYDKTIFEYDEIGRILSFVGLHWNSGTKNWKYESKQSWEYPGEKKLILINYEWDTDSLNWIPDYKYEEDYDENGNQILEAHYIYLPSKKHFMPARKFESFYSLELLKVQIDYYSNSSMSGWAPSGKKEYTYNSSGEKDLEIYYDWNSPFGEWTYVNKYQYSYDDMDRLTNIFSHKWVPDLNQWLNRNNSQFSYDENGNRIKMISSIWDQDEEEWSYFAMEVDTFDQFNNSLLHTRLTWNHDKNSWVPDRQVENAYDSIGNLQMLVNRKWEDTEDNWQPIRKNHYGYDLSRNKILDIRYNWDIEVGDWLPWQKEIREYLPNGESFLLEVYRWSAEYSAWLGHVKFETLYNISMLRICEIKYFWMENDWYKDQSKFFYYHVKTVGIGQLQTSEINIFPNPTSGLINITGLKQPAKVKVYSIQGQLVRSDYQVENSIDISELEAGVYVLSVLSEGKVVREVVVKH